MIGACEAGHGRLRVDFGLDVLCVRGAMGAAFQMTNPRFSRPWPNHPLRLEGDHNVDAPHCFLLNPRGVRVPGMFIG
jgi:hypothetical protein